MKSFPFKGLLAIFLLSGAVWFAHAPFLFVDYKLLVEQKDPRVALQLLAERIKEDPALENSCHGITHDIGHAAYEKYGFREALAYEDDICGSGYMHGVTEEYIEHTAHPLEAMLDACPPEYGACFHGVGHGLLLYYENDIPSALEGCSRFDEDTQKVQCSEGVFMQSFATEVSIHKNPYLNPEDTLSPCSEQEPLFKSACYFYSPRYYLRLHPGRYGKSLRVCMGAEPDYVAQCVRGVGSVAMKQNINNIPLVEGLCSELTEEEHQYACVSGMSSYYVIHTGSLEEAYALCSQLKTDFATVCEDTVAASAGFFMD